MSIRINVWNFVFDDFEFGFASPPTLKVQPYDDEASIRALNFGSFARWKPISCTVTFPIWRNHHRDSATHYERENVKEENDIIQDIVYTACALWYKAKTNSKLSQINVMKVSRA